mmetsp:Transcript_75479/g.230857  ORF Transcript_75479/g.230857 Transcript_75479/m.230857 type:complete len:204 (-) Transcript_75479:30-641(-)
MGPPAAGAGELRACEAVGTPQARGIGKAGERLGDPQSRVQGGGACAQRGDEHVCFADEPQLRQRAGQVEIADGRARLVQGRSRCALAVARVDASALVSARGSHPQEGRSRHRRGFLQPAHGVAQRNDELRLAARRLPAASRQHHRLALHVAAPHELSKLAGPLAPWAPACLEVPLCAQEPAEDPVTASRLAKRRPNAQWCARP